MVFLAVSRTLQPLLPHKDISEVAQPLLRAVGWRCTALQKHVELQFFRTCMH